MKSTTILLLIVSAMLISFTQASQLIQAMKAQAAHPAHLGNTPMYCFDEGPTGGKCEDETQCDGERYCSSAKVCQGQTGRNVGCINGKPGPKNPRFSFKEISKGSRCKNDWECDGKRTCSNSGFCFGDTRF